MWKKNEVKVNVTATLRGSDINMRSLCFPYVHCLRNHEIILSRSHSSSTEQLHFTRSSASGAIHYLLVDKRSILIRPILAPEKRICRRRYQFNWRLSQTILMTKNVITFNESSNGTSLEARDTSSRQNIVT